MSKKEAHKEDLAGVLEGFLKKGKRREIDEYLLLNSNLPSPRANLELAEAFAELVKENFGRNSEELWDMCQRLVRVSQDEAPVNDPKEFLPFCGAVAIGAVGSVYPEFYQKALTSLRELSNDPRWRTREAVAKGIQKLLAKQSRTWSELESWIEEGDWLAMRAVAAGVAEPAILNMKKYARFALELHRKIFAKILGAGNRDSEEFRKLKQGLGYSLSVVVHSIPEEGFEYMHRLADSQDPDILWIVKQNLKKKRLTRNFPNEVASIRKRVE